MTLQGEGGFGQIVI